MLPIIIYCKHIHGGSIMDFTKEKPIGDGVDSAEPCVKLSCGYDSNFVLNSEGPAAVLKSEMSGIIMSVLTTEPGVQVYSANFLTPRKGKNGARYSYRHALCLETQHFPDSIHHPETLLIVLETLRENSVESSLSCMAKRRMT